jgi:acyl-CoA thioesterase I
VVVYWIGHEGGYDSFPSYNGPGEYTIDCHAAAGGGSPPAQTDAGWKTLAAVTDAPSATTSFGSRQHYIPSFTDGGGTACNWIRLRNTVVNGSSQNWDVGINMDVYDASQGLDDDWIFYGDSITCGALNHNPMTNIKQADFVTAGVGSLFATLGAPGNLSELIAASKPGRFPLMQMGGHDGWLSADGVTHVPVWLPLFPGRFVALDFGTNDGGWSVHPADFQTNMQAMIDAVRAAGRTIIIPTIPSPIKQATVDLNVVVTDTLWKEPGILPGPDLYAFFSANPTMLRDGLHPTDVGYVIYRNLWAQKLIATVY